MEATRQEKLKRRSEKQKLKLKLFFERSKISTSQQDHSTTAAAPTNQEVNIGGMRYLVSAGGNKLIMVPGEIEVIPILVKSLYRHTYSCG